MKKILVLSVLMVTVLTFTVILSGCTGSSDDRDGELKSALDDVYTNLSDTFSDSGSKFSMIEEYIDSWAKTNEISVVEKADTYMVLRNGATEDGQSAESVTLFCPVDTSDLTSSNHSLSVGLASILGPSSHGKIDLIIAESDVDGYKGASDVPGKYLNSNNFIDIDTVTEGDLKTFGSYAFDASLFKGMKYEEPEYTNAYEVSMSIGNYKDLFDYDNNYPNPIQVIGNYLATCKSGAYLFQLSSLECQLSGSETPSSASAVVIIDDNNVSKMQKKFDKSFEKLKKRCDKLGIDLVYTFTETSMPEKALKDSDASRIISLLYTLDPGVSYQDEDSGNIIAANDFTKLILKDNKFVIKINARSKTRESLSEMRQSIITTAGLCDMKYNLTDTYKTWESSEGLSSYFKDNLKVKENADTSTLRTSDLNILSAKKKGLNCIYYGYDGEDDDQALKTITGFMSSLATEGETE